MTAQALAVFWTGVAVGVLSTVVVVGAVALLRRRRDAVRDRATNARMRDYWRRLEGGATAIEYALIVGAVAVALLGVSALADRLLWPEVPEPSEPPTTLAPPPPAPAPPAPAPVVIDGVTYYTPPKAWAESCGARIEYGWEVCRNGTGTGGFALGGGA